MEVRKKECGRCGYKNRLKAKKCYNCGADLSFKGQLPYMILGFMVIFLFAYLSKDKDNPFNSNSTTYSSYSSKGN